MLVVEFAWVPKKEIAHSSSSRSGTPRPPPAAARLRLFLFLSCLGNLQHHHINTSEPPKNIDNSTRWPIFNSCCVGRIPAQLLLFQLFRLCGCQPSIISIDATPTTEFTTTSLDSYHQQQQQQQQQQHHHHNIPPPPAATSR